MQEEIKEKKLFDKTNKYLMLAIIILLWGALYLPKLGLMEVQGTESRRMMPASTMYHGGSLMMPELAGKQYIAKPPLIYWLEAASYSVLGENATAARFPTTLLILIFPVIFLLMPCNWLSLLGRFIGSVIFLTASGCIMSGRSADIDGGYMVSVGLSIIVWLNMYTAGKSKLQLWFVTSIILGLGMLFKGPLILLFFYLAVICFLIYNKSLKELFCWQHLIGIVLMLLLFLPWTLYVTSHYHSVGAAGEASSYWLEQMLERFNPATVEYGKWLSRVLGAIIDFAPWFLLVPFLWVKKWTDNIPEDKKYIFKALRLALLLGFLIINVPGTRSRYTLPLYPLASILTGWLILVNSNDNWLYKYWKKILLILFTVLSVASFILFIFVPTGLFIAVLERFFIKKLQMISEVYIFEPTYLASILVLIATLVATYLMFRMKERYNTGLHMVLMTSVCILLFFTNAYAMVFPYLDIAFHKKQLGAAVTKAVPLNRVLYVYKQGYEPYYYYFNVPMKFIYDDKNLPQCDNNSNCYFFLDSDKLPIIENIYKNKRKNVKVISEKKYKRDNFLVVEATDIP